MSTPYVSRSMQSSLRRWTVCSCPPPARSRWVDRRSPRQEATDYLQHQQSKSIQATGRTSSMISAKAGMEQSVKAGMRSSFSEPTVENPWRHGCFVAQSSLLTSVRNVSVRVVLSLWIRLTVWLFRQATLSLKVCSWAFLISHRNTIHAQRRIPTDVQITMGVRGQEILFRGPLLAET